MVILVSLSEFVVRVESLDGLPQEALGMNRFDQGGFLESLSFLDVFPGLKNVALF